MFRGGTILLLLGPFDGLRTAILDPKEITEGLDGLTGRRPSPTLGEGGQVHYKEEGCRQYRHIAGAGHLNILDAASEMNIKSLIC